MTKAAEERSGAPSFRIEAAFHSAYFLPLELYIRGFTSNPWVSPPDNAVGDDRNQNQSTPLHPMMKEILPSVLPRRKNNPSAGRALSSAIAQSTVVASSPAFTAISGTQIRPGMGGEREAAEISRRAELLKLAVNLLRNLSPRVFKSSRTERPDRGIQQSHPASRVVFHSQRRFPIPDYPAPRNRKRHYSRSETRYPNGYYHSRRNAPRIRRKV